LAAEAKRAYFAVYDNAEIKSVLNAKTGEREPVFTGGEAPPPECEAQNGWYAPATGGTLVHCRTKRTYIIGHSAVGAYPENYRPLKPKPGTDDPGPMERE
jgi:hypothetical protein